MDTQQNIDEQNEDQVEIQPDFEKEYLELKEENAKLKDQLLRAVADKENTQKRLEKEKSDLGKYVISDFARELLQVADSLNLALKHAAGNDAKRSEHINKFVEGVELTQETLLNVFEKSGIKKINPVGEKFDHNFHQAMVEIDSDDHEAGTIVEVFQQGYTIGDRLLRPAMVSVAKA
jgi:molecular chaperone GrpE